MLIGADVEFFIKNSLGEAIPAFTIIPNDKNNPLKNQDVKLYFDNVLLEFNIPPSKDVKTFVKNITNGINFAESKIRPNFLDLSASAYFNSENLEDKRAKEAGCEIEYNAYNFKPNNNIEEALRNTSVRTSGGHLHLSGEKYDAIDDKTLYPIFVYMMDLFVAIPSILIEKDYSQRDRRKIFGKAGSYRIKPYGIEYRVLSSWWTGKPEYSALIYRMCEFVFEFMNNEMWKKFWNLNIDDIYEGNNEKAYSCFGYDVDLVTKTKVDNILKQARNTIPTPQIPTTKSISLPLTKPKIDKTAKTPFAPSTLPNQLANKIQPLPFTK
jgi:hypothetical protein